GDEVASVDFEAGKASLDESQQQRLSALAAALQKRPALVLEVKAVADQSIDARALRQERLEQALQSLGEERSEGLRELAGKWLSADAQASLRALTDPAEQQRQTEQSLLASIEVKPLEFTQ